MRFVIADDSDNARPYAKRILVRAGHEVVGEAANGAEAVDLCRALQPDVALLDIAMPVMSGDVAAKIIRNLRLATHVVLASSQAQDAILDSLRAIGCHFVGKPYQREQLLPVIDRLTDGAR